MGKERKFGGEYVGMGEKGGGKGGREVGVEMGLRRWIMSAKRDGLWERVGMRELAMVGVDWKRGGWRTITGKSGVRNYGKDLGGWSWCGELEFMGCPGKVRLGMR
jgi:hypothetical protein